MEVLFRPLPVLITVRCSWTGHGPTWGAVGRGGPCQSRATEEARRKPGGLARPWRPRSNGEGGRTPSRWRCSVVAGLRVCRGRSKGLRRSSRPCSLHLRHDVFVVDIVYGFLGGWSRSVRHGRPRPSPLRCHVVVRTGCPAAAGVVVFMFRLIVDNHNHPHADFPIRSHQRRAVQPSRPALRLWLYQSVGIVIKAQVRFQRVVVGRHPPGRLGVELRRSLRSAEPSYLCGDALSLRKRLYQLISHVGRAANSVEQGRLENPGHSHGRACEQDAQRRVWPYENVVFVYTGESAVVLECQRCGLLRSIGLLTMLARHCALALGFGIFQYDPMLARSAFRVRLNIVGVVGGWIRRRLFLKATRSRSRLLERRLVHPTAVFSYSVELSAPKQLGELRELVLVACGGGRVRLLLWLAFVFGDELLEGSEAIAIPRQTRHVNLRSQKVSNDAPTVIERRELAVKSVSVNDVGWGFPMTIPSRGS